MLTVSVVINNYNYAAFLREAIDSALAQTYPAKQVIVVDDGSTDASRDILRSYEGRIDLRLQDNRGQAAALNLGLSCATGDVICLLDSDDVWLPHKLATVVSVFEENPRVGWLRHKLDVCDAALRTTGCYMPTITRSGLLPSSRYFIAERLATASTSALCFRQDLVSRVFPIPERFGYSADAFLTCAMYDADAYISTRLAGDSLLGYSLDRSLGLYRRHGKQQYRTIASLARMIERQVEVDLALFRELSYGYVPSTIPKHRLIASWLGGQRRFSLRRLSLLRDGVHSCLAIARAGEFQLAARQMARIAYAYLWPDVWLRRLLARSGFDACAKESDGAAGVSQCV